MAQTNYKMLPIENHNGYFIDTNGDVWTNKPSLRLNDFSGNLRKVKLSLKKTGYKYANIYWGSTTNDRSSIRVHRIVYSHFVGPIPETLVVDHINGDKGDNRVENLQLLTKAENTKKYWETDDSKKRIKKSK